MAKIQVRISEDGLNREVDLAGFAPTLWYRLSPYNAGPPRLEHYDFALIALLPLAMHRGEPLELNFPVDLILLDGLDHYQEVWQKWRPDLFSHKIKITPAAEYRQGMGLEHRPRAVAAFSAGVDSTFMAMRHRSGLMDRGSRDIRTAVLVHGFEIPLESEGVQLRQHAELILAELGVDLVTVKTNWRQLFDVEWPMTFGSGLAAILHQFSAAHDIGLVATDEAYENQILMWGSFCLDRFFSGSNFRIELDGGRYDRIDRVSVIAKKRSILEHVRVCWPGAGIGENCGVCPKCILTMLNLLAAGVEPPWPFAGSLNAKLIKDMPIENPYQLKFLSVISHRLEGRTDVSRQLTSAIAKRLRRAWWVGRTPKPIRTAAKRLRRAWQDPRDFGQRQVSRFDQLLNGKSAGDP